MRDIKAAIARTKATKKAPAAPRSPSAGKFEDAEHPRGQGGKFRPDGGRERKRAQRPGRKEDGPKSDRLARRAAELRHREKRKTAEAEAKPGDSRLAEAARRARELAKERLPKYEEAKPTPSEGKMQAARDRYEATLAAARKESALAKVRTGATNADRHRAVRVRGVKPTTKPERPAERDAGYIGRIGVKDIETDPTRFQFKGGLTDSKTGTTEGLKDVRHWNEELAGVVSVWKDPANGKTFVVNGHHRLALAQRLGVDTLPVRYLHAADAPEARAKGALQNIAEGRGTALDAAKFFRDTRIDRAAMENTGLSMREKQIDTALGAARVTGPVWHEVYNERIDIEHAAMIGNADLPPSSQVAILKDLQGRSEKGKAISQAYVREAIDDERHAPSKTETSAGLFGDVQEERKLSAQAREFRATVMERIGKDKRIFSSAARNAERLQAGGNVIDSASSEAIAKESGSNAEAFQAWKRHPQVKRIIDEAVVKMAETNDRRERTRIGEEAYGNVVRKLKEMLRG